jgi:hypothetical protein
MKTTISEVRGLLREAMERLGDPALRGDDLDAEIKRSQGIANLAKQYVADRNADTEAAKTTLRAYELAEEFDKPFIVGAVGQPQAIEAGKGNGVGRLEAGKGNGAAGRPGKEEPCSRP